MKKAILVVSFGTSYAETRKVTIDAVFRKIKNQFNEYEIRRAFTSHIIINKLKKRDGIIVNTPEEVLQNLYNEGFEEVVVQPLHMIPGEEYDYVRNVISHGFKNKFKRIVLGRPLLFFKGEGDIPDDYTIMVKALEKQLPKNENVILMGHGSIHYSNAAYSCFECVLRDNKINNVYMGTVEGYPSLERVIKILDKKNVKQVTLMPFMIVTGDHARNDMAGDDEDSWKKVLETKGFKVNIYLKGLGENTAIQDIYVQHIKDAVSDKYINLGKTKKGGK